MIHVILLKEAPPKVLIGLILSVLANGFTISLVLLFFNIHVAELHSLCMNHGIYQ